MTYVLHILQIKLWEWEAVKENAEMQMNKGGRSEETVEACELAMQRICELKIAIDQLNGAIHKTDDNLCC